MSRQATNVGRIATMVLFALSCFGLLVFLWGSFGGPLPLAPKGYRVDVRLAEVMQLAQQAEVRISGVPVGRVVAIRPAADRLTRVTMEIDRRHAPLSGDAKATLRTKTLLGETYVELTPGSPGARPIPEGGELPRGNVRPTVELDEVLQAFDPSTRRDLERFVVRWAAALEGRGAQLNDALGNLEPAVERSASLLEILDRHSGAMSTLVRDAGRTFDALGRREAAARALVTSTGRILRTTARRDRGLTRLVRAMPPFLAQLRPTLTEAERAAADAAPSIRALRPVAPLVAPGLRDATAVTGDLDRLLQRLDPVVAAAMRGLPAARRLLRTAQPLVGVLHEAGRDLVPVVDHLGRYRWEITTMLGNVAAATQAKAPSPVSGDPVHYIRILAPLTEEGLAGYDRRLPSNRYNPYFLPGAMRRLEEGLLSFACDHLDNPQEVPVIGSGAPPCRVQPPAGGRGGAFPHLERAPR